MMQYTMINEREMPRRTTRNKLIGGFLTEVMKKGDEENQSCFEVLWRDDYQSAVSCRQSLYTAIKRGGYPLQTMVRGHRVFLIRTDMHC